MCGRYSYNSDVDLEMRFGVMVAKKTQPNWNAAPTQMMPVIRDGLRGPVLEQMKWGIIAPWEKEPKARFSTFNARSETIFEKATYRNLIMRRRCLIPFTSFFEWRHEGKNKLEPYAIYVKDEEVAAFAGLWEIWKDKHSDNEVHSYTIITTQPNEEMRRLHDRMPVILLKADEAVWLNEDIDEELVKNLMVPLKNGSLKMHEVNKAVGNVKNNYGELLKPLNSK